MQTLSGIQKKHAKGLGAKTHPKFFRHKNTNTKVFRQTDPYIGLPLNENPYKCLSVRLCQLAPVSSREKISSGRRRGEKRHPFSPAGSSVGDPRPHPRLDRLRILQQWADGRGGHCDGVGGRWTSLPARPPWCGRDDTPPGPEGGLAPTPRP